MSLKPCVVCGTPSSKSRCEAHRPKCHRSSPRTRGYDTAWDDLSKRARRLQPWCFDCGATEGLTTDHTPEAWSRKDAGLPIRITDVDVVCNPCNIRRGSSRTGTTRGHDPKPIPPDRDAKAQTALHTAVEGAV